MIARPLPGGAGPHLDPSVSWPARTETDIEDLYTFLPAFQVADPFLYLTLSILPFN